MTTLEQPNPSVIRRGMMRAVRSRHSVWAGLRADVVRRTVLGRQETIVEARDHTILLNLRGRTNAGEDFLDGRRVPFHQRHPGSITFIPAGCDWMGWDDGDADAAYFSMTLPASFVSGIMDRLAPAEYSPLAPNLSFEDPAIVQAANAIAFEIGSKHATSVLLVEAYATAILARVLQLKREPPSLTKGGLRPAILRRTIERMDQHLASQLTIMDLARDAGLSGPHFCRAFKQSTGVAPHTYLNRRRLERAKGCLLHTDEMVSTIAQTCGFSSAGHLSTAFKREFGITPVDCRRARSV